MLVGMAEMLRPYEWRSFRPELLARSFLAAKDRQELAAMLARVPGARAGAWEQWEPADPGDGRVAVLGDFLAGHRWTQLSLPALCGHLLAALGESPS
jgi:hypothetical protein